ncbi:hypothetical protein NVT68_005795 [Clostridium botulinum]|uniref:hypothetical protein n=1 Tax=Clostridium botulinum TaxID=1491 RepID=UPI001FAB36C7|nr:hypothetical protein [Clostridium botulinum]MDI6919139.1 hypothetical protein [Clostridium botulinum]WMU99825.1 hypothetical protein QA656_20150 [Clostridium botulinum]
MHLKTMKVIEFPKNKMVKDKMKKYKLETAIMMLEALVDYDFTIIVNPKAAENIFNLPKNKLIENFIITTDINKAEKLEIKNSCYYQLTGNELT